MNEQSPKLVVYLGSVPGVGKTHRLLDDGIAEQQCGRRVAIGWIETKGRPDLEALAQRLPKISPVVFPGSSFAEFDLESALASDADIILVDELAHTNAAGAVNAKRWQDVLQLRAAGKSVYTTCNVYHLEAVAPVAERVTEFPIAEIVPMQVVKQAERIIAIDTPIDLLMQRLEQHAIVRSEDVVRAAKGILRPRVVHMMREFLFRVIDDLTVPEIAPSKSSRALALVIDKADPLPFLQRVASIADALNLAFDVTGIDASEELLQQAITEVNAARVPLNEDILSGNLQQVQAALVALPVGRLAERMLREPLDRSLLIADPARMPHAASSDSERLRALREDTAAGKLTIYFGSVAGSGKTYAMLERAQQLRESGCDVVAALIETHGRAETAEQAVGLEFISCLSNGDVDIAAVLARKPQVVLIDEFAHSNTGEATHAKRYEDILEILAAGIDVVTTVNVQHIEGVVAAVERLTSTRVQETVPDEMLELASDVVFIDVSSDVLQQRLRDGKIYPMNRVETALTNFFRYEHLVALRELALREITRARSVRRFGKPLVRIILGVAPRERESRLIEHVARLAKRIGVKLWVFCITPEPLEPHIHERLSNSAAGVDAIFFSRVAKQAAEELTALAGDDDLLTIESPRMARGLFGRSSFATRMLKAGARELLVIAPLA